MTTFIEYSTTFVVPWIALVWAMYSAWLSNPSKISEHYAVAKRSVRSFLKRAAPFFCAASFTTSCLMMPDPVSKSWLIAAFLSLLALCTSLAVAWVDYVNTQIAYSLKTHIDHLRLFEKGFDAMRVQHDRHYDFTELSAQLHMKTLGILMKQFVKPENKTLAAHTRAMYQGDDAVEILSKLMDMMTAASQYADKNRETKDTETGIADADSIPKGSSK